MAETTTIFSEIAQVGSDWTEVYNLGTTTPIFSKIIIQSINIANKGERADVLGTGDLSSGFDWASTNQQFNINFYSGVDYSHEATINLILD